MFKKNLLSPQVYIYTTDKSDYYSLTSTKSYSGGGLGGGTTSGGVQLSNPIAQINGTCTATKYSQGYDPFVTYCYNSIIVDGVVRRSAYVECNYMI